MPMRWLMPVQAVFGRVYVLADAYIRVSGCVYTRWRMRIYVSAQSYIGVGSCPYRRWSIPAPALARHVSQVHVDTSEHHHPR